MVSILTHETMSLSLRVLEEESSSSLSSNPTDAVIFVGISLLLGIASRHALRGTRVPYTVALLVLGVGLGALEYETHHRLGKIGNGIRLWANIDPDLLLAVFLPALLFESSFSMEVHQIKRCIFQMFLLAGPGVLISTFLLGSALKLAFPYNWSWKTSLLLGGLLSATDPVAVVALLKELRASKKLSTIIEGESLMNDGTAIVVYQLFYRMVLGWSFSWGALIKFLSQVCLGAVGIGLAFGIASVLWLGFIFNDTVIEITLTLAVSYIAYFTVLYLDHITLRVLSVRKISRKHSVLLFLTTQMMLFSLKPTEHGDGVIIDAFNSGVVIAESVLRSGNIFETHEHSWGYLFLLYVFVQVSRMATVGILFPFLQYLGYGLDWKEAIILVWSGLRGAVALSLSLSVKRTSDSSSYISSDTGALFVFLTGGIVFLTLIVNGSTTQFVLHILKMDKLSEAKIHGRRCPILKATPSIGTSATSDAAFVFHPHWSLELSVMRVSWIHSSIFTFEEASRLPGAIPKTALRRILKYTKYEMLNKAQEAFGDLGDDEELGPADWPTVQQYIASLSDVDGEQTHPQFPLQNDDKLDLMNLKDIRVRFLNGVQAAYWVMLDEGRITQTTANLLMQSVDEAIDLVPHEVLCDWNGLKSYVNIPNYYSKVLQSSIVPRKLVTYFIVERLESKCYICAAFLRAHRIARQQLHEFIGDSEGSSIVIRESEQEGEEARKFLENVRVSFPQVLHVVKTRQVTYSVLNHLIDYVHNLAKIGLLEEKEMSHLHDAVQTDMKKLLRNPPLVKLPKIRDLINANPLLGALPLTVREKLVGCTKETLKLSGATLFREGSKPAGIWLISNGVVKWSSKNVSCKPTLHPTFTHGSTLGLYEVLAQKAYICDIITDSLVHCFFIETEKILSALGSNPEVEDFFWRESVIVIAKLLLPQMFEKVTMQELRSLIAERSSMNTYIRGESFELLHHSVGFLLEGFIKVQGGQEGDLLTAPAAILPHVDQSFRRSETLGPVHFYNFCIHILGARAGSFSLQVSLYQVETRARVFIFDVAGFEAGRTLRKRSSSVISHSTDHPARSLVREHGGLMSWPEQLFKSTHHDRDATGQQENNLSSRAMQLSIFGSMINMGRRRPRSFPRREVAVKPSHSKSCPKIHSIHPHPRPMVSVKSEGSTTLRKNLDMQENKQENNGSLLAESNATRNESSDDSGCEDEHIIRIDSPSRLSFHQDS
ncbi:hypothetical protein RD792_011332 [Penstemon davidsonii]|uniref:Cyclic nucleotide-binding domain-containing protein n=1 Tax=Penstemon davidsonii TaxID=160366 RepID=A0ABR0D4H7_9LAMI|nr:hypothetical protein RD792_011332 [Penstemon davidsonii]